MAGGSGWPARDRRVQGGGPNGDLFVIVDVAPDADFGRNARNLTVSVPITFPEAVFGADVRMLDFGGNSVTLRIPPGTRSGKTFRVRGRGVKTRRGTGDLLVSVEIAVPTKLSGAEQAAVEALRDRHRLRGGLEPASAQCRSGAGHARKWRAVSQPLQQSRHQRRQQRCRCYRHELRQRRSHAVGLRPQGKLP